MSKPRGDCALRGGETPRDTIGSIGHAAVNYHEPLDHRPTDRTVLAFLTVKSRHSVGSVGNLTSLTAHK